MRKQAEGNSAEKLIRILAFTMVLSSMSATMFNIVLPEIKNEFQLSVAQVSWVSTIYMLIYAIGSVIYGKLADVFRFKNLITFGLAVFVWARSPDLPPRRFGWCWPGGFCRRRERRSFRRRR
ncbi:hypothetical protein HMSSN036_84750 [Paenibacillus macerans]|nr:hypothetical protein HMSSN036_84750 [Paenibacillus macerans]